MRVRGALHAGVRQAVFLAAIALVAVCAFDAGAGAIVAIVQPASTAVIVAVALARDLAKVGRTHLVEGTQHAQPYLREAEVRRVLAELARGAVGIGSAPAQTIAMTRLAPTVGLAGKTCEEVREASPERAILRR